MSIQTATNRFILPPKAKSAGLYQQLLSEFLDYERLGDTLIGLSEQARIFRQFDLLSEYALILSNLPSEKYQIIGQYYLSLVLCRNGLGEMDKAETILEKVASVAPLSYRTQAMVSLSAISWVKNQPSNTIKYCIEAIKMGSFDLTTVQALRGIAVLKGREGFHHSSLCDLENLYPMMKYTPAHIYLDYLNSLAVELAECGRLEEARNITKITCSSPLVVVYPEWRETGDEITLKAYRSSRSFVPITQGATEHNIVRLPERENIPISQDEPGRVLYYDWENMVKKRNNENDEAIDAMDEKELLVKLIQLTAIEDVDSNKLRKIVKFAVKVMTEQNKK